MNVTVWLAPSFPKRKALEESISFINRTQQRYTLNLHEGDLPESCDDGTLEVADVFREKKVRFGSKSVIVATERPLRGGWDAYPKNRFYIFSIASFHVRYQFPPMRSAFTYWIAGILGNLECGMSEAVSDQKSHQGRPTGCISDLCEKEGDMLKSMKKAHVCERCKEIYLSTGLPEKSLDAIDLLLADVRSDAKKYDKKIPYDVFLSYSHSDKRIVDRIAERLERERFKVWRDDLELLPGHDLLDKLMLGIATSHCFVPVFSPGALGSPWARTELKKAIHLVHKRRSDGSLNDNNIKPALVKSVEVFPEYLEILIWADLRGKKFERGLDKLCLAIRDHLEIARVAIKKMPRVTNSKLGPKQAN